MPLEGAVEKTSVYGAQLYTFFLNFANWNKDLTMLKNKVLSHCIK